MGKRPSVLTIGTFDGVHRGHQEIVRETCRLAEQKKCLPLAITFDIPPRLFFFPSFEPALLTTTIEKQTLLKKWGIKQVAVLHFDSRLSKISARDFFEKFIVGQYRAQAVVVGYNFGFGRDREGDIRFLEKMGESYSIPIRVVAPYRIRNLPVSSGRIRDFLRAGKIEKANSMLGDPYFLMGRVIAGKGVGRKLGFPTANLSAPSEKILPEGVFAVRVSVIQKKYFHNSQLTTHDSYYGMCNIGFRPTLSHQDVQETKSVEVHLFHFSGNLYGKILKLEFFKKLRSEKKFTSLEKLKDQLKQDKRLAAEVLSRVKKD